MRDFSWSDTLYGVVKADGTYAGVPCLSWEEAVELSNQHEGSKIFVMMVDSDEEDFEPDNIDDDTGYDPYMGCFSDDC
jgi:hypothetical protein